MFYVILKFLVLPWKDVIIPILKLKKLLLRLNKLAFITKIAKLEFELGSPIPKSFL